MCDVPSSVKTQLSRTTISAGGGWITPCLEQASSKQLVQRMEIPAPRGQHIHHSTIRGNLNLGTSTMHCPVKWINTYGVPQSGAQNSTVTGWSAASSVPSKISQTRRVRKGQVHGLESGSRQASLVCSLEGLPLARLWARQDRTKQMPALVGRRLWRGEAISKVYRHMGRTQNGGWV